MSVGAERVSCLYVRDSVADLLIPMLVSRAARLRLGNPLHGVTDIGPVIDDVAVAITREQVEDAIANGAALLGKETVCVGRQLRPMILDHVQPCMRVCNEELEGPLLPVIRFSSLAEVPRAEGAAGNALAWSEKGRHAGWWGQARRSVQPKFF
jgi:acyl-CoA reductase-like NAD-dependent aldehyde dehydrogenase